MNGPAVAVTVLGCDGSYPGPGGACSGYLLVAGGATVLLDAGSGTLANLQRHVRLDDLDAVVLSHAHPDHWSDIEGLYVALRYYLGRSGLQVWAPAGLRELVRGEHRDGTFDWRETDDGSTARIGSATWTWSRTDHPVETLACRVDADGASFGYSADTGPAWSLGALGRGMQLALVEATGLASSGVSAVHLTAGQAGAQAAEAGVGSLALTHLAPGVDRDAARQEAAGAFDGPVDVAVIDRRWTL